MLFRQPLITWAYTFLIFGFLLASAASGQEKVTEPSGTFGFTHSGSGNVHAMIAVSWVEVSAGHAPDPRAPAGLALLDGSGNLVWYSLQPGWFQVNDFRASSLGNSWSMIRVHNPDSMQYVLCNQDLSITDTLLNGAGTAPDAHEFHQVSSSTWLLSGRKDTVLGSHLEDGIPSRCFVLEEMDRSGKVIWKWNSCHYLLPDEGYSFYQKNPKLDDYCHGNAAFKANDSLLIVSMRNMNAVVGIRYPEGTIAWRLGGRHSDFTFLSDSGFSGQHDCKMLDDSTLSLMDNGNMSASRTSRVVVYRLNFQNMTARRIYEYVPSPRILVDGMGSADWKGDTLLFNYGRVFRPTPSLQVVAGDSVLRTWNFPDSVQVYRAHFCGTDLLPERPVIRIRKISRGIYLFAPAGWSSYLWNTGEKCRKIRATEGCAYQVWIPYGIGYLSSLPIKIDSGSP